MCLCVCLNVCVVCLCVCLCARETVCLCVSVRERERKKGRKCVCVCLCAFRKKIEVGTTGVNFINKMYGLLFIFSTSVSKTMSVHKLRQLVYPN